MAFLPHFSFPSSREAPTTFESPAPSITGKRQQPQLHVQTELASKAGYSLAVPGSKHSRPVPVRTLSTPPASPTRNRSSTMGSPELRSMHDSGAITPPVTPGSSHSKSNSASSDFLSSLSGLRRGDSTTSLSRPRPSLDETPKPGSTELINFPYQLTDYEFRKDEHGRKKTIGEGAWSDVYLAEPCPPKPTSHPSLPIPCGPDMSPPLTPIRTTDFSTRPAPTTPPLYAIKVPAMTSAKKVLNAEARILSYLSRFPDAEAHIVPFYGLDPRTGSLVLQAMDSTLESWIQTHLNPLSEPLRSKKLVQVFPSLALSLIDSLHWMHDKHCTHADIKPSNILIANTSPTGGPHVRYSDFSSTMLAHPHQESSETQPLGAGTWDYLDPVLLQSVVSNPPSPTPASDLWSLAITLLFLVIGASPYDAFAKNKFLAREMIKAGDPLACLGYGEEGARNQRRLGMLSECLGFDVRGWFARVLVKEGVRRACMVRCCSLVLFVFCALLEDGMFVLIPPPAYLPISSPKPFSLFFSFFPINHFIPCM
ncbi:kinase-like protein [Decorospora gaudefroyi]|uniref:Autophagy-related protein 1 n=1 Tax=Decorospora gaudefroyi TaxID=184978 RepID=A0A6A5K8I7_9PLEO|nr:kinase-like protein [Decorospora gaudefroyi]